jgi:hypothetical protein
MTSHVQGTVLIVSSLLFVLYAGWMLRRAPPTVDV